jgi:two-component system, NtrC family, sensor kinase
MSQVTLEATVLIIDDTPTNLEVLYPALDQAGYKVLVEMDGQSGIATAQRHQPDLILLDVMMPGIDGFETCQRLKSASDTSDIPIIFMTALADTDDKVRGLNAGAVDYITKPFQQSEVLARIKLHLSLRQANLEVLAQKAQLELRVEERTSELSSALRHLQETQAQLIQQEKMSALGGLVAGVAHEINNPIGCIIGNASMLRENVNALFEIVDLYQATFPTPGDLVETALASLDLPYLREDLPKLMRSMQDGADRIQAISRSLRNFSRADQDVVQSYNLHDGIDSTIMILRHRLKANEQRPEIEVVKNYGELPVIDCFPGQLNQVFMNILANAIDALDESNQGKTFAEIQAQPNQITITTKCRSEAVELSFQDNGCGMPEAIKARIFDHLFTTKEIGKGTGLGLAIVRQIIQERHKGTITLNSQINQGTEFTLRLPIQQATDPVISHSL